MNYESESGPDRPGIFQASIESAGYLVAYFQYQKIAELKIHRLVRGAVDIFGAGPVHNALDYGMKKYITSVRTRVGEKPFYDRDHWESTLENYWFSSLCRLLLRIKNYHHGGAIIISSESKSSGLNIKYPMKYPRLRDSLIQRGIFSIRNTVASDAIMIDIDDSKSISADLYLEESTTKHKLSDIKKEVDGCLWFISLLSRVDGSILMDRHLRVRGFGVEIKTDSIPDKIVSTTSNLLVSSTMEEVDYNHFGTRHRSMMRYCWKYPGSVGFVISQDGDVRVMTRPPKGELSDSLIIFENIRLQLFKFIRYLIPRRRK